MKNLIAIALVALAFAASGATYYPPVVTDTNGVLRSTNFFGANMGQLTNALNSAGFAPGGGTGNADTNSATAWAQKQTFLGDVLIGPTNLYSKLSSLDSGKANADSDLDALAGLALTGVMARTGAATYALRTLTGDSEVTIANGDGVAGNPTFSLASGITRDSELSAAISALSSVYQEDDADLAAYAALATSGLVARTGSGTVAARTLTGDTEIVVANGDGVSGNPTLSIGAAIARVAAVAAGYQPLATALTRLAGIGSGASGDVLIRDAVGFTNLAKSTDGKVLKLVAGLPAWADDETGASSGNADTNSANGWSQKQTFAGGVDAPGTNTLGVIHVTAIESDTPLSQSIGGTGGTNAESSRVALGLQPDVDVQTYRLALKQLALAILASGDMPFLDSSGVVTNTPSKDFGRSLLNGVDAAAVRALLGAVYGAGDTMTGHLKLPTHAYDASTWTNGSRTNEAVTRMDVANKIEQLAIGGAFFSSVSSDFTNAAGQLQFAPEATAGTGKILRETAAGTNSQLSGLTDVVLTNPQEGDSLIHDGSVWRNKPASRMELATRRIEIFTSIFGTAAEEAISLDEFTSGTASSGTKTLTGVYAGRNGVWQASAAPAAISSGAYINKNGSSLGLTNEFEFDCNFILVLTNGIMVKAGFGDTMTSTNFPTDACQLVITNGLMVGESCAGGYGSRTQTATSFLGASNTWYRINIKGTNTVAHFRLYTNLTQLAWTDSVSSTVPNNTQLVGPGIIAMSTGSQSTNKMLLGVDTFGIAFSVQ